MVPDVDELADRPVRLVLRDDLDRSRLTVFFRLFLAIPHYFWLVLFTIGALLVVFVGWICALVTARLPGPLHGFLAAYVRYTTHVFAYLSLAANPYPGFAGDPGYPVDIEIDPPRKQRRLSILLRWILALPALVIAAVLASIPTAGAGGDLDADRSTASADWAYSTGGGALWAAAFLAWFAVLVRGRTPHGLRNLSAYALEYSAWSSAYAFLLTDRYPNASPTLPAAAGAPTEHPVYLRDDGDGRQSRLTVFFRLFLAIPHLVWITLWTIPVLVAWVVNWLLTLIVGRSPTVLHRFLAAYVRYRTHVTAYLFLLTRRFPGFTGGLYELDVVVPGAERQSRLVTLFRLVLAVPALLVSAALAGLVLVAGFFGWFFALVTGRMPGGLRAAAVYATRYGAQTTAYMLVLTDRYPHSSPPVAAEPVEAAPYAVADAPA